MDLKYIEKTDVPLTLTAISQFRQFLDVLEEFVKNTEQEQAILHQKHTNNNGLTHNIHTDNGKHDR